MFPLSRFDKFLVILGIAAVFCLTEAGAGVALTAMLVIIGAPLTILMAAIPGLFLFLLLARLLWFGLKWTGPLSWPLSGVLAVGLLAIVPYMQNRKLDEIALEQLAGDRNKITGPVKLDTLAVVYPKAYYQKGTCGDFCQRALLNGVVRRMIMVRQDMPGRLPGDETIGKSFRIERRQKCPPINLEDGIGNLSIPGEKRDWANKTPLDLLRLKAATGECLIEEEAPLARADAVLVRSPVKSGLRDYYAGLDPFADTVRASRLSFYLRQEGRIVERYRSTGVQAYHLLPVLIPSYVGLGMHYKAGLLRRLVHFGDAARYRSAPELEPFLLNVLGLDLKLDTHKAGQKTRRIITSALDKPGKIDVTATLVIESFFRETSRRKDVSIDDVPLILRVLEDERVPVPYAVGGVVRKLASRNGKTTDRFAKALFARLFPAAPDGRNEIARHAGKRLASLGQAIAGLPDDAIVPYRAELEKLARDPERRVKAYLALIKLKAFGNDAVPIFIYLIDDAANYRDRRGNSWQHPYLAGLEGLCLMGHEGRTAIAMLTERIRSHKIAMWGSYWGLAINTLISLGAKPEDIWPYFDSGKLNQSRKNFDWKVRRALKDPDCGY